MGFTQPSERANMKTADLLFPFWMLVHRGSSPWRPVMLTPGLATAFTTSATARAFGELDAEWEFRLVCRATLARLSDEFDRQGVRGVCLDPVRGQTGHVALVGAGTGTGGRTSVSPADAPAVGC
jgi:hypothetical protein